MKNIIVIIVLFICGILAIDEIIANVIKDSIVKNNLNWNRWKPNGARKVEGRWNKIVDVVKHKRAYLIIQSKYWHITLRGIFHDCDKLILLLTNPFLNPKEISEYHKIRSHHHSKAKSDLDFRYQIFDYECSGMTKPDAPMRAQEYLNWKHQKGGISETDWSRYQALLDDMKIPE